MQNKPVQVLIGENEHAKRAIITNLKQQVLNNVPNDFNYNVLYGDSTPVKEVLTLANTFSFTGGNRLIILKNFDKFSATDKKILAEYSQNPSKETCLIIIDNSRPDKRAAWYKLFDKQKQNVELKIFWPYKHKELINAVSNIFKKHKKNISYPACEILADLIETTQQSLDEEVKKIIDYCRDKNEITLEDIKENIKKGANHDIYEWAMAITSGETSRAIRILNNFSPKTLKASQLLIFVINDRFIKILKYLTLLKEGMDFKMAQKSLGIMPFLDPRFHHHATRYSIEKLHKIFDKLIDLDFKIKTGQGEAKLMLEEFVLET